MQVKAAPGLQCPKEDNPREYIAEEVVEVPDSSYYRRLLDDGSLVEEAGRRGDRPVALTKSDPTEGNKGGRK